MFASGNAQAGAERVAGSKLPEAIVSGLFATGETDNPTYQDAPAPTMKAERPLCAFQPSSVGVACGVSPPAAPTCSEPFRQRPNLPRKQTDLGNFNQLRRGGAPLAGRCMALPVMIRNLHQSRCRQRPWRRMRPDVTAAALRIRRFIGPDSRLICWKKSSGGLSIYNLSTNPVDDRGITRDRVRAWLPLQCRMEPFRWGSTGCSTLSAVSRNFLRGDHIYRQLVRKVRAKPLRVFWTDYRMAGMSTQHYELDLRSKHELRPVKSSSGPERPHNRRARFSRFCRLNEVAVARHTIESSSPSMYAPLPSKQRARSNKDWELVN